MDPKHWFELKAKSVRRRMGAHGQVKSGNSPTARFKIFLQMARGTFIKAQIEISRQEKIACSPWDLPAERYVSMTFRI